MSEQHTHTCTWMIYPANITRVCIATTIAAYAVTDYSTCTASQDKPIDSTNNNRREEKKPRTRWEWERNAEQVKKNVMSF